MISHLVCFYDLILFLMLILFIIIFIINIILHLISFYLNFYHLKFMHHFFIILQFLILLKFNYRHHLNFYTIIIYFIKIYYVIYHYIMNRFKINMIIKNLQKFMISIDSFYFLNHIKIFNNLYIFYLYSTQHFSLLCYLFLSF